MSSVTSALIFVEHASNMDMFTATPVYSTTLSRRQELAELERFKPIDAETPGGYKYMEVDVFACAFNYIITDDLIQWFDELPWKDMDTAVLLITPNDGGVIVVTHGDDVTLPESS